MACTGVRLAPFLFMATYNSKFWSELERYHELAESYERNIIVTHPNYVTSNRLSPWFKLSTWNATAVKYYEHRP